MSEAITLESLSALPTEQERIALLMKPLNPGQRAAAMQLDGPVAAIAGAGAGKTKTLIHRTAHLLLKGVPATSIMLVTFTNKGAEEIKTRLEGMVGSNAQYITAGTFHSIIYRTILKGNADHPYLERIGINMDECAILDESDASELFKEALNRMTPEEQEIIKDNKWDKKIEEEMAAARAKGQGPEEYAREKIGFGDEKDVLYRLTHDVWKKYTALCRDANGIDFDDILVVASRFLESSPEVGKELAERFRYLMLDEYQDTNPVQMKIMDSIARHHQNIFVVGDEKQSIYRFRGADIKVILGFNRRYPGAKIIEMGMNYRSSGKILAAANIMARCMNQKLSEGTLEKGRKDLDGNDRPVAMVCFDSDIQEAKTIAASIRREMAMGIKGKDMAILYRSRTLKNLIERELVSSGIAYQVVGDVGFYQRQEVKNTIAFLRMMFRPWDSMAVLRVLKNTSFGVSDKSAKKAMSKGQTAHAFLKEMSAKNRQGNEPTAVAMKLKPLLGAMQCIRRLVAYQEDSDYIRGSIGALWKAYLGPSVKRAADRDEGNVDEAMESRMQNVNFLLDRFFTDLKEGRKAEDILDELTMMTENSNQSREQDNLVKMMTIHASKGMEFRHVYMPGMDMDTTPGLECKDFDEREEERRIFYVGMTRAMEKLVITYAKTKLKWGQKMRNEPSPFLRELSEGLKQDVYQYVAKTINYESPER
jgi:DNA helicase-2/ATP-dependent DNA helicase PcrA